MLVRRFQIQLTEEFTGKQFDVIFQPSTPEPRQPHESVAAYFQRLGSLSAKGPGRPSKECLRDVAWLYRAEIQQPPDKKTALAKEYHIVRSGVQDGIKRAAAILSSITLHDSPELPADALDDLKARRAARRAARNL